MVRGTRRDGEAEDARWVPPRHRPLHRAPHRTDAATSPAPGGDLQALPRPGEHGGREGRALSATTVSHIHRTLRKALADAVDVEQLLAANPAARSKRPRKQPDRTRPGLD